MMNIETVEAVDGREYRKVNGTFYSKGTKEEVIRILEQSRGERLRFFYGAEGKPWNDEYDTIGKIGRSMGDIKVPLLVPSKRSMGGMAISTERVIRIDKRVNGKIVTLYHDGTRLDKFIATDIGTVYNETKDKLYARCKNGDAGKRLAAFMNGERWSK